ncbi:MAG TPA: hypothetical protein VM262_19855 [Acidimicrobiales bacterium]|nr:hypothetical protein [Acidimicrobiales bacterium]
MDDEGKRIQPVPARPDLGGAAGSGRAPVTIGDVQRLPPPPVRCTRCSRTSAGGELDRCTEPDPRMHRHASATLTEVLDLV